MSQEEKIEKVKPDEEIKFENPETNIGKVFFQTGGNFRLSRLEILILQKKNIISY